MIRIDSGERLLEKIASCAYEKLGLKGDCGVEFIELDEEDMRALNRETRNIDSVTDVLSYPNLDKILPFSKENYPYDYDDERKEVFLGSIVICNQVAMRQAEEYGHSFEREKGYLFLHGLLHLLGYDHIQENDKTIMRSKEEEILSALGVNR